MTGVQVSPRTHTHLISGLGLVSNLAGGADSGHGKGWRCTLNYNQ